MSPWRSLKAGISFEFGPPQHGQRQIEPRDPGSPVQNVGREYPGSASRIQDLFFRRGPQEIEDEVRLEFFHDPADGGLKPPLVFLRPGIKKRCHLSLAFQNLSSSGKSD